MLIRSRILVGALGFSLPLACSSFTTVPAPGSDVDAAVASPTADVVVGPTTDAATDAAFDAAQIAPARVQECGNWTHRAATFDTVDATGTEEGACSLCPTSDSGGEVTFGVPLVAGVYAINMSLKGEVTGIGAQVTAGFQLDGADVGTDVVKISGEVQSLSKTVTVKGGGTTFTATIATDSTPPTCIVVSSITITYTP